MLAVMDPRHDLLIADQGELVVASSSSLPASGRILLKLRGSTRRRGHAHASGTRFAPGIGLLVDGVLDRINNVQKV
ncbi:hypothetical protein BKG82_27120 [Mycobacteroides chelonae]|uniref:Uncharacterized protein n=1 Tax=Mycobacteroides chelonae TaxID=1774 RepID=A0A1S1LIU7_MYCCH|nr:hypothetical protein BKG82_27120 [Mycobacteroides chelonae]